MSVNAWMYGWGGCCVAAGAMALVAPGTTGEAVRRFPRNRVAAWILSGLAFAWAAWVLRHIAFGRFSFLRDWALPAAPVIWILANRYMDELLAPRALGGLLLLAAEPWLFSIRAEASDWGWIPATLAYLTVLAGLALLLSPYLFRRAFAPILKPTRLRQTGLGLVGSGLVLGILGATLFS